MNERSIKLASGWLFAPVFLLVGPAAVAGFIVLAAQEHHYLPYGLLATLTGVNGGFRLV